MPEDGNSGIRIHRIRNELDGSVSMMMIAPMEEYFENLKNLFFDLQKSTYVQKGGTLTLTISQPDFLFEEKTSIEVSKDAVFDDAAVLEKLELYVERIGFHSPAE